jgi:hypothetical protein
MPEICRFNGITIHIYYDEHNPPHFHAVFAGKKAVFRIDTLEKVEGNIGRPQELLVVQWAYVRREDLYKSWEKAIVNKQSPGKIKPLE